MDGAVNSATGHFIAQRVTAILLIFLGLWFAVSINGLEGLEHINVVAFIASPVNGGLLALTCVSLAYHSYLGVQVVIEDYVHAPWLNKASLIVSRLAHLAVAVAALYATLGMGAGA